MELVSTAILSALAAGAAAGATKTAEKIIVDAYQGLKDLLKRKFGSDSKIIEAVGKLEEDHESRGWQESVTKEIDKAGADRDPEVVDAAEALLEKIKASPGGGQYIENAQYAVGNYIAQADRGSTATVNVNRKD